MVLRGLPYRTSKRLSIKRFVGERPEFKNGQEQELSPIQMNLRENLVRVCLR